jgi:hypothetical protein
MEGTHHILFVEVRRKLLPFLRLHYVSPVIRIDNLPYMLGGLHLQFISSLSLLPIPQTRCVRYRCII